MSGSRVRGPGLSEGEHGDMRPRRVLPEDWRVVRGLLKTTFGLVVVSTVLALAWERPFVRIGGSLWQTLALYYAVPVVAFVAVVVATRPSTRARRGLRVAAALLALVLVSDALRVAFIVSSHSELYDLWRERCGPVPADCREMASEAFAPTVPALPTARRVGGFHFVNGQEDILGPGFTLVYEADEDASEQLLFILSRSPMAPPIEGKQALTPGGKQIVEVGEAGQVNLIQHRSGDFYYAVGLAVQGPRQRTSAPYRAAIALIDSLR